MVTTLSRFQRLVGGDEIALICQRIRLVESTDINFDTASVVKFDKHLVGFCVGGFIFHNRNRSPASDLTCIRFEEPVSVCE